MRVFITGGAGFIGSHLATFLLEKGWEVTAYDNLSLGRKELLAQHEGRKGFRFVEGDLLHPWHLEKELAGHDLVYHMAANSDISQGSRSTDIDLKNGTIATYNLLETMRKTGLHKMVFASTSAVYGEATLTPTPENYGPLYPISFYGASKLACEALCKAFSHNYEIQIWAYRFANIVGPHSTHGVIHDFVKRLKADPSALDVLGNGKQRKSYLHIEDCLFGMQFGFENRDGLFQLFNLAGQGVTSVRFIAEETCRQVKDFTGVESQISFGLSDRGWKSDVPYTYLDGSTLAQLGWQPSLNSNGAVERAVREIVSEIMS